MTTARAFLDDLHVRATPEQRAAVRRYFRTGPGEYGHGDVFLGVRMGEVFALARQYRAMPVEEIEELLESPFHEARAGAVKIMAERAAARGTTDAGRHELFALYLRRIDRIDSWDLVDLGAWEVVGRYLADHPRELLDDLARSGDVWERRTAVLATLHFLRRGEFDDAVRIATVLRADPHDLVRKPVGGILRETGRRDPDRLLAFLDEHAGDLPRTVLRYATERLTPQQRAHYRSLRPRPESRFAGVR